MTRKENNIVLFSITLCWASSYIFIKDLPSDLSSFAYLTLTTGIAGIILVAVFWKKLKQFDGKTLLRGVILALMMTGELLAEKGGLSYLPSSNASFIASLNILFVPLLLLLIRVRPTRNHVAGIAVILFGLALTSGFSLSGFLNRGTVFMTAACLIMAVYTISASSFTKKSDPLLLGISQICFTAVIGFVLWFIQTPTTFASLSYSREMLSSIFMLAFFSKAYAYIMLMYSQRYTSAISVTIIASTEPVVTLTLALLIPNSFGQTESFQIQSLLGALCIAFGAVIAGTNFLSTVRKRIENQEEAIHEAD